MKKTSSLKYYNPKKSRKHIFFFNVLPVALAAAVLLGIAGNHAFRSVEAKAKTSLLNIETKKSILKSTGGSFHILEITPKKDNALYMTSAGGDTIMPVAGSGKASDSDFDTVTGNFGYLISGQEPIDFDATLAGFGRALTADEKSSYLVSGQLDGSKLREKRSEWAAKYLKALENAGIASLEKNKAPLQSIKASDGSYYKELKPWDDDVSDQKTVELSDTETVFINGSFYKKNGGSFVASASSYDPTDNGSYMQHITNSNPLVPASDLDKSTDISDYVFYKPVFKEIDLSALAVGSNVQNELYTARKKGFPLIYVKDKGSYRLDQVTTGNFDDFLTKDDETLSKARKLHNIHDESTYAYIDGISGRAEVGSKTTMTLKDLSDQGYYASRLDTEEPFEEASSLLLSDWGGNAETGYFNCNPTEFDYVGNGQGDYEVSDAREDSTNYQYVIHYDKIRYTGGYTNNNWFLKNTLDFDDDDKTIASIASNVYVDCVKPDEVSSDANAAGQSQKFSDYDLVVISGGLDLFSSQVRYSSDDDYKNAELSDLTDLLRDYLDIKGPVFADSSVLANDGIRTLLSSTDTKASYKYMDMGKALDTINCPDGAVYRSVYIFRGQDKKTMASGDYTKYFDSRYYTGRGAAFKDVYDEITQENALRERKNPGTTDLLDKEVSTATALRYIINYDQQRGAGKKSNLKVLDIEPESTSAIYDDNYQNSSSDNADLLSKDTAENFKKNTIMKFLPDYDEDQVSVTTVSTRTLAGLTDDITEIYDLVYIGDNRGRRKDYNDSDMNKTGSDGKFKDSLVYYNIGDTYQVPNVSDVALNGMLDKEYNTPKAGQTLNDLDSDYTYEKKSTENDTFRYSGNDISIKKQNELTSFIKQGFPVIISDGLTSDTSYSSFNARLALSAPTYSYDKSTGRLTLSVKPVFKDQNGNDLTVKNAQGEEVDPSDIVKCSYVWYRTQWNNEVLDGTTSDDGSFVVPKEYQSLGNGFFCRITSVTVGKTTVTFDEGHQPQSDALMIHWDAESGSLKNGQTYSSDMLSIPAAKGSGISKDTVDENTRLFETLKKYQNRGNVKTYSAAVADGGSVESYASLSSPEIKMESAPKQYNASDPDSSVIGDYDGDKKIQSTKKLDFTFRVVNETDLNPQKTTYTAQVFADLNSDGVFDASSEEITSVDVKENGSSVLSSNLKGGVNESQAPQYELSAQLPESLQGAFTWKLVVSENADSAQEDSPKDSYKGVSFVGLNDKTQRIKIRILQFNSDYNYKGKDDDVKAFTAKTGFAPYDLEKLMKYKGTLTGNSKNYFGEALTSDFIKEYYDLSITTVQASKAREEIFDKDKNWLNNYDMLILGFSDSYEGLYLKDLKEVEKFVKSGKAVLFCHDNSTYRNINKDTSEGAKLAGYHTWSLKDNNGKRVFNTSYKQPSAFDFNILLRSQSYMDVYGISDSESTVDGRQLGGQKNWGNGLSSGILASGETLTDTMQKAIEGLKYSVAYKPVSGGSASKTTVPEVHGYSDAACGHRLTLKNGVMAVNDDAKGANNMVPGIMKTDNISQVNKGQITSYPYEINLSEFSDESHKTQDNGYVYTGENTNVKVSRTHAQWYQLNTNADNIVVWYTVENNDADRSTRDIYSHNDCINNYYIYNCGNITYTGAGDSDGGADVTEYEAQLFVNTMIAAFRTSVSTPSAKFVSGPSGDDEISQAKIEVQTDTDGDASDKEINGAVATAKLYFRISDNTVAKDKTNGIYLYDKVNTSSKNGETTYTPEGEALKNVEVRDTDDKVVKADSLKSGKTYYITIPIDSKAFRDLTGGKDSSEIWLQPYNEVGRSGGAGSITKGKPVKLSISLIKSGLMNLG